MKKSFVYLIVAATVLFAGIAGVYFFNQEEPHKEQNAEETGPVVDQGDATATIGGQTDQESLAQEKIPAGQSRLNMRFLDVGTGTAVIPDFVEINLRGTGGKGLRSTKNDVADNGSLSVDLENGLYDITVRKAGYLPMSTFFDLKNNDLKVNFNLEPITEKEELSSQYITTLQRPDALVVVGYVVDDQSGKPLANVNVQPADKVAFAITDKNGFFQFHLPLPSVKESVAKRNKLYFQKEGYTTEVRSNFDIWPNGDMILQIRMRSGTGTHEEKILLGRNASISLLDKSNAKQ